MSEALTHKSGGNLPARIESAAEPLTGMAIVDGGTIRMRAAINIVSVRRGRATIEFDGRMTEIKTGDVLYLDLTCDIKPEWREVRS